MPTDPIPARSRAARASLAWLVLLLAGCVAVPAAPVTVPTAPLPAAAVAAEPSPVPAVPALAPAPAPQPALASLFAPEPMGAVLDYADRIRPLPAPELAQEIQRLGEASYTPVRALQLAVAMAQARQPGQLQRAQALLQRVLAQRNGDAERLHALARLLATQLAEQRRLEEHAERQAQQLREAQRRIDQLNDRLEAVRAIERSVPTRQRRDTPPPAPRRPSSN